MVRGRALRTVGFGKQRAGSGGGLLLDDYQDLVVDSKRLVTAARVKSGASEIFLKVREGQPAEVVPMQGFQIFTKRLLDISGAVAAIFLLAPLFLLIAIAIKLTSPGPVVFCQERVGKDGQLFAAYKLRTMHIERCDRSGIVHTAKDDPRITQLGRFLRRTSIDELPQLFNVLRGEMSLVGPRPHVPAMLAAGVRYAEAVPYYHMRHKVLPGMTGWAQINGARGRIETMEQARQRIDFDIAYAQHFSVLLDLRILWMTVLSEFITGSGE